MRIKLLDTFSIPIVLITILSITIRLYKLVDLMPFIGDQAWFYLSAQDALSSEKLPLVGITASRTWLHQGAFWTYVLMPILKMSAHPAAPAYFTAFLGTCTVIILYKVLGSMTDKKTALIGAFLYATSPLIVMSDRMPYHTSLTPLLMIGIFYALWKIIQNDQRFWIALAGLVAIMQNVNLAGFPVVYIVAVFFALGRFLNHSWAFTLSKKNLFHAFLVWMMFMMPYFIYDMTHGFHQTIIFYGWMILEPIRFLSFQDTPVTPIVKFLIQTVQRLLYLPSWLVSSGIFIGVLISALRIRKSSYKDPLTYTLMWMIGMFGIVIAGKTPSDAYVYTLFPLIIMLCAQVVAHYRWFVCMMCIIGIINCAYIVNSNYLMGIPGGYGAPLSARIKLVENVISDTQGSSYAIKVVGPGEQFSSTGMYFEYIAGWLGHAPVKENPVKTYEIYEKDGQLEIERVSVSD